MAKRSKSSRHAKRKKEQNRLFAGAAILVIMVVLVIVIFGNSSEDLVSTLPLAVSVEEAYSYREDGAFILDVRTQQEWDAGHIPGAILIPLDELPNRLNEVPENMEIVVVCRSGNRSGTGRDILLSNGFTSVTSMEGGVNQWQAAGYPFE